MTHSPARVDLHLHSYASNVTDYYAANSFSIPESYSNPLALHRELKRQGMSLVTLTDHNSISGALEMLDAGLEDVFLSAEMTATFPEDGCNIHVTVANLSEAQFAEVNRLRRNVYEMVAFLDEQIAQEPLHPGCNHIAYFMTHPLMSTQNRPYGREGSLSIEHIEKALLLCNTLEVRNGTRTRALNEFTHRMLRGLDRKTIERLANKHDLAPKGDTPWLKSVVGGSDDHSGINPGRTWTQFAAPVGRKLVANDLIAAIHERRTAPEGLHGGPMTLAHAMLKLLYDGQRQKSPTAKQSRIGVNGPLQTLLRMVFEADSVGMHEKLAFRLRTWLNNALAAPIGKLTGSSPSFERLLASEIDAMVSAPEFARRLELAKSTDERIFCVVSTLLNRIFASYAARLAKPDGASVVQAIKELVALVSSNLFVSLPYLLSYLHQSSDRSIVRDAHKAFDLEETQRLVLVTDTFFEVNGVSRSIRRIMDEAQRRGVDLTVVTCLSAEQRALVSSAQEVRALLDSGRLVIFDAVVDIRLPQYEGLRIHFPPFLELLRYLQEAGFTKMQISTPGTVGIAGLLAAKILQIETSSTYHTSFPEYVESFTQDTSLEALTWKYMILFYHSVDEVVVPSKYIAKLLHERGLRKRSLLVLDRWVDLERFHPKHRTPGYWSKHGLPNEHELVKFLYVGRLSVEKNLALLVEAYRELRRFHRDAHLVLIGDGPFRSELEKRLAGLPVTFTGVLQGGELSRAIASCDAKLFPSTTDTWGNAPLEAQASGLPVVVSDMGGPQELMQDTVTGYKVSGRDLRGLVAAMDALMNPVTRARLGRNARAFAEARDVHDPFTAILDSASYRRRAKLLRREEQEVAVPETLDLISTHVEIDIRGLDLSASA